MARRGAGRGRSGRRAPRVRRVLFAEVYSVPGSSPVRATAPVLFDALEQDARFEAIEHAIACGALALEYGLEGLEDPT